MTTETSATIDATPDATLSGATPSTPSTPAAPAGCTDVTPELLARWLADGDTLLVDVREDFEFAEQHIAGVELVPLSRFDPEDVRTRASDRRVVFMCRTGRRSADAASRFGRPGEATFHLAGGIEGWRTSGHPVVTPATAPRLPVMRQVQIAAGSLVAAGTAAGVLIHPGFLAVPAFVGCGLVFAGVTGWCGMAAMLARMPWNRRASATGSAAACCAG